MGATQLTYSPIGDIIVLAMSLVMIFLLAESYINSGMRSMIFRSMIGLSALAAVADLLYHFYLSHLGEGFIIFYAAVYIFRDLYQFLLLLILNLYIQYLIEFLELTGRHMNRYRAACVLALLTVCAVTILGHFSGVGYVVEPGGMVREGMNFFHFGYVFYIGILAFVITSYRTRIIQPVYRGVVFTSSISVLIMCVQGFFHTTSLTTITFILPLMSIMYLIHTNPYDLTTGALGEQAFNDMVRTSYQNNRRIMLLATMLKDYEGDRELPKDLQVAIFKYCRNAAKDGRLFKVSDGRLIYTFDMDRNLDVEGVLKRMHDGFLDMHDEFKISYRCLIIEGRRDLSQANEYLNLIRYLEPQMSINSIYQVADDEIENYTRHKFILSQLEDIHSRMQLDDPRVLVYCQPVYNVATGEYDTAEALMRLELPELGMIFPDQFIPLAEKSGLIHALSLIILNKTCMEISRLLEEKYLLNRISVNFSILEVRDDGFCDDIINIIRANHIPYGKIAIELTESRNATDFEMVKKKVNILKDLGIKFYLDDFGTGYSNFDRIMELPVDIIKFDRSLVIESSKDKDSEYMVYTFADMFNKLNYHVLYEGIETPSDERRCIRMFAQYLQGYKYSKPIPIGRLREFLSEYKEEEEDLDEAV